MIELGLDPTLEATQGERAVYVQDEPALEIALPQVFEQPALTILQRGKLPNVEGLVAQIFRRYQEAPAGPLGQDYQELVTEFQPLFAWTIACWDYLLSTEGCRFVPRQRLHLSNTRGDYRAVTDKDYSRIVHAIFRSCVMEFAQQPSAPSLSHWLRERMWPLIRDAYRKLENPPDPRQRVLTPYSYLRCVPYQFLNDFHHALVYSTLQRLPEAEWRAIEAYFLHFYTEAACVETLGCAAEAWKGSLRSGLIKLLVSDRLVYCLLRQIERY
jgi:hypothetical protein